MRIGSGHNRIALIRTKIKMSDIGEKVDKTTNSDKIKAFHQAGVAELADALRSGRSELTLMWVQIPPSAQLSKEFN